MLNTKSLNLPPVIIIFALNRKLKMMFFCNCSNIKNSVKTTE